VDRLVLKPAEAAEVLGVGRTKVYELIANGELPGILHIGRSVRISKAALEQWIAQQAVSPSRHN
jgi:excisionase family DNA binding protein